MADFVVGGFYKRTRAIIDDDSRDSAVCIIPFSVTNKGEYEAFSRAIEEYTGGETVEVKVMTRNRTRIEKEKDKDDSEIQNVQGWSVIEPVDGPGDRPSESVSGEESVDSVVTVREKNVGVEECLGEEGVATSLDSVSSGGEEFAQVVSIAKDIGPVSVGKDREEFREAVKADDSLKEWKELGDRRERGFRWHDGVLVRGLHVGWEEFREVIVLPKSYRERVMKIGHDRNGHLGADKVHKLVNKYFVWPSMARDLIDYCGSCELCQKKSKAKPRRAPAAL